MAGGAPISSGGQSLHNQDTKGYGVAIAIMATLFFMIGFFTVLNDVLVTSLDQVFKFEEQGKGWMLTMIQMFFFFGYFVMSVPAGMVVTKLGYKKALLVSIGTTVLGLAIFCFAPSFLSSAGASTGVYIFFLVALFIVAMGFGIMQVVINPYLGALGRPETAASRMSLGGFFNSFATFIGPILGGVYMLAGKDTPQEKADAMIVPYVIMIVLFVLVALLVNFIKLPVLSIEGDKNDKSITFANAWKFPRLKFGVIAIFVYVGAEVAIGTWIVKYIVNEGLISFDPALLDGATEPDKIKEATESVANGLLPWYWGGAMVGRLLGTGVTQKIRGDKALAGVSFIATLLVIMSTFGFLIDSNITLPVFFAQELNFETVTIPVATFCLLLVGLFNSIMWPSIFPLAVKGLGKFTGKGSGLMVTMVVGGAIIQFLLKLMADGMGSFRYAFLICAICYIYIYLYATKLHKKVNPEAEKLLE